MRHFVALSIRCVAAFAIFLMGVMGFTRRAARGNVAS